MKSAFVDMIKRLFGVEKLFFLFTFCHYLELFSAEMGIHYNHNYYLIDYVINFVNLIVILIVTITILKFRFIYIVDYVYNFIGFKSIV